MKTSAIAGNNSSRGTSWNSRIAVALGALGMLVSLHSWAATFSWSGGGAPDGNWSNDANWGFAGHPADGDSLIFSFPQPNQIMTNNLTNLVVGQIRFVGGGGGYSIRGNAFTVTNNIVATNTAGVNVISNSITLGPPAQTVTVGPGTTLALGLVSGTNGIIKSGSGTLAFGAAGGNNYTGPTVVIGGVLQLGSGAESIVAGGSIYITNATIREVTPGFQIGALPVTIDAGGVLDLNGFGDTIGTNLNLRNGGAVQTGAAGTLYMLPNPTITASNSLCSVFGNLGLSSPGICTLQCDADLAIYASISGASSITKQGLSGVYLVGSNSFSGNVTVAQGGTFLLTPFSLGTTNGVTVVSNGASLAWNNGGFGITNESLTLNGAGYLGLMGALSSQNNNITNTWAGPIVVNQPGTTIAANFNNSQMRIAGPISGPGGVTVFAEGGTNSSVVFEGNTANTYAGVATVNSGTLVLNKPAGILAVPHNLVLSGASSVVRLNQIVQTADSTEVSLAPGSLFDFGVNYTYVDKVSGLGTVNFGNGGWISVSRNNGSSTFDGVFTGLGFAPGWSVGIEGTGTFTMNGNNTFSQGNYTVYESGKLVMNGSHPRATVLVNTGGAFGGSGTVGDIAPYSSPFGTITPGGSPGILTCSNATFGAGGVFAVELTGPTAGVDYDQLKVRGGFAPNNCGLSINMAFAKPVAVGQQFTIVDNDGADAVGSIFLTYATGTSWIQNGYTVVLTNNIGPGNNDVVLTLTQVPGAAVNSGTVVTSGNGDGAIGPNECNYLGLVITNKTGTPMTGVTGTITCQTPGVIVTEASVPFPNIPANGKGTNVVPFQLAMGPNFVCGTNINLTMTVSSSTHGTFIIPVTVPSGGPAAVPVRFDFTGPLNVPDFGTNLTTNVVSVWNGGPITKVAVSLWLNSQNDGDLSLTLIAPDGTPIDLSSGNGGEGINYGTGSADGSRTTFDDAGGTPITAGSPPYVGTFQPEQSLASLIGTTPVGNWRLRIADTGVSGLPNTLRNWSLFLYGTECALGSGTCELCPNIKFTSTFVPNTPLQQGYLAPSSNSVCGIAKPCPGLDGDTNSYPAENFTFRNGGSDACMTVTVSNLSIIGGMAIAAYSGSIDPTNRCATYLADPSAYPGMGSAAAFSFNVAANAAFVINVLGGSLGAYDVTVSGGDCRPVLNVTDVGTGKAKLEWSTASPNYQLESTNVLGSGSSVWPIITNAPVVINSRFQVTNTVPSPNQFYHLRKSLP